MITTSRSRRQEFSFEEYYIKVGKLCPQSKINEGCRKCSGITWKGVKVGGILTVKLNLEIKRIKIPCVLVQSVLFKLVIVILLTVKNGRGLLKVFVLKRELTETMVSLVLCCGLSLLLRSTFRWCVHLLE